MKMLTRLITSRISESLATSRDVNDNTSSSIIKLQYRIVLIAK